MNEEPTDYGDVAEVAAGNKPSATVVGTRPVRPDGVDKVTGRARFGADMQLPGSLVGMVFRSPHAHARLLKVDVSAALALPGVKAIVTAADLPEITEDQAMDKGQPPDFRDMSANILARENPSVSNTDLTGCALYRALAS